MKNFIETIRRYKILHRYSEFYRLCWIPGINRYSVIEFLDEEIKFLDIKKVEILI